MAKIAEVPVSFEVVQIALNRLGYKMSHNVPDKGIVVFKRESGDESYPSTVTIKHPDCTANGGMVYEKDYVADLLGTILGREGARDAIMNAVRTAQA